MEDGGIFERCDNCLIDEDSSEGDVRDCVLDVGTVAGREGICFREKKSLIQD